MRFSLNFVKEFIDPGLCASELAQTLTMAGMEVEAIEKMGSDYTFDIEITTNRYDWLSVVGISREIAACLHKKIKIDYPKISDKPVLKGRKIIIDNSKDCCFYIGRVIRDIKVGESPAWLKERVLHSGVNSISSIVDITNYCMIKWGNPMHAFDEDKIKGDIYIRRAKKKEKFVGIDEKERELTPANLVIADDEKVIALAGVMGAKNTEVDENTKNVFLEAAIFDPFVVRTSRRAVGLDTDSSYRFERRVNADCLEYASAESAKLIEELGKGKFCGYSSAGLKPKNKRKPITIDVDKLNNYLGSDIGVAKVRNILSNLGCNVIKVNNQKLTVMSSDLRFDIDREVDVYEEISRIYGFDKIPATLPFLSSQFEKQIILDKSGQLYSFTNELRSFVVSRGLNEIITYSMEEDSELEKLGQKDFIRLSNPMRSQENVMRTTLLLGMVKAARHNLNRNQSNLKLFEIANTYSKTSKGFNETSSIALACSGKQEQFFYLKAVVEDILKLLNIADARLEESSKDNFDSALELIIGSTTIGCLGKLNKKIKEEFSLKEDLFFIELNLEALKENRQTKMYVPFSTYPAISRDISIALKKNKRFKDLEKEIYQKNIEYLSGIEIVDVYKGKDLPPDVTAFTLRVFYQSRERTLTSQEVDSIHNQIRENLTQKSGIILR